MLREQNKFEIKFSKRPHILILLFRVVPFRINSKFGGNLSRLNYGLNMFLIPIKLQAFKFNPGNFLFTFSPYFYFIGTILED